MVLLVLALYLALLLRRNFFLPADVFFQHLAGFIPLFLIWIICLYTANFYSLEISYTGYKALSRISVIAVLSALLCFAVFYHDIHSSIFPKTVLVLHSLISAVFIALWRWFFYRFTFKFASGVKTAFVGINDTAIELLRNSSGFSYMSYRPVCFFDDTYDKDNCCGIPVIKDIDLFIGRVLNEKIVTVVFAEGVQTGLSQRELFTLHSGKINLVTMPDFYETYLRRIPVNAITELWFLKNINPGTKRIYQLFKRLADVILSFIGLLATLPLWPGLILLIKWKSPGPFLFEQERVGCLGEKFKMFKFRTMTVDNNNTFEPATPNDIRLTRFGGLMRKSRIDEIPQFINILKGDMSFIGPRPERPELVEELEKAVPFYRQRLLVKPGLSGWDQVSGEYHSPSKEDTYKKLQYDLYYIKNMSPFLDISILCKTIATVFSRAGV